MQSGENERLYGLFLRPSPIRDHTSRFTAKDPLEEQIYCHGFSRGSHEQIYCQGSSLEDYAQSQHPPSQPGSVQKINPLYRNGQIPWTGQ